MRAASSHPESVRGSCQEMLWRKLGSWGEAGCSLGLGGAASPKPHWPALTEPQHFTCMHRNLPTGELATQWRKSQTLKSNKRVGLFSKGQRKPPFWCSLDLMVNNQGKYRKCSPSSPPCKGRLECPEMVPKPCQRMLSPLCPSPAQGPQDQSVHIFPPRLQRWHLLTGGLVATWAYSWSQGYPCHS